MPAKPVRRGIKLFCRNAGSNGYLYDAIVYLGKATHQSTTGKGIYHDLVMDLCQPLRGNSHTIYMDNLYSSVKLFRELLEHRLHAIGTVRSNRKYLPADFRKPPRMRRGESRTWQDSLCPQLTCTLWEDTKVVRFLSTATNPNTVSTGVRRISGVHTEVNMPAVAKEYGRFMGGTDRHDRLRMCYEVGRQSLKAWKYIFFFFLNSAIVNSWIIYKENSTRTHRVKKYTHFNFRHEGAIGLIGGFSARKRNHNSAMYRPVDLIAQEAVKHENAKILSKGTRRCAGHKRFKPDGKDTRQTVYSCVQCDVPLCKMCHYLWHRGDAN